MPEPPNETVEASLLAAIVEAPDDDAPRLVYADWLQGRGDPRGELIQLQCQLAADPDAERRRAIRIAENKLLGAHLDEWLAPVREVLPPSNTLLPHKFELHRGLVEEAQVTLDCGPHLRALWTRAPLLRRLRLSAAIALTAPIPRPRLGAVVDVPELARLRALRLDLGGGGNAVVRELAACSQLQGLRDLELHLSVWGDGAGLYEAGDGGLVLDDEGAAMLAHVPHLERVESLVVDSNRITASGVGALGQGPWRLRRLDLAHNPIDGNALADALDAPAFAGLEELVVSSIAFDDRAIARLVSSPTLAHLRELELEKCKLGAGGVQALCRALALPSLRRLRLERNGFADAGARAIADCEAFAHLTSLEAGHNRMGQKGAVALSSSPHLANLERLTLSEPRWKAETAALFSSSTTLANTKIYLQGRLVGRKQATAKTRLKTR